MTPRWRCGLVLATAAGGNQAHDPQRGGAHPHDGAEVASAGGHRRNPDRKRLLEHVSRDLQDILNKHPGLLQKVSQVGFFVRPSTNCLFEMVCH